jgi:NNP family nitrate/nitrite transporter-like MFS transporter
VQVAATGSTSATSTAPAEPAAPSRPTAAVAAAELSTSAGAIPVPPPRRWWIDDWRPEDAAFWARTGSAVARRNLVFSIFSEHVGFSIWSLWSVFVLFLGPEYHIDPAGRFLLTTLPTAVGAALRLPYTFAVRRFGGRNWTICSAVLLLAPCVVAAAALHPGVPYGVLLAAAAVAGVGGGNFASSMANIDSFYPQRRKGWALGLNAGGGNIGVAAVQLVGLAVLAGAGRQHPRLILAVYIPLVVFAAAGAALFMDNLTAATRERRALRDVSRDPHAWVMSVLYIGTFGSFIGFGFAFGQVLQVQFRADFDTPLKAAYLTFLGPLVGSLVRPVGGRLADRFGGALVTFWNFVAMAVGAAGVLAASVRHSLPLFLAGFIALFTFSGLGNGSTYKMIPAIFRAKARLAVAGGAAAAAVDREASRLSAALIGLAGAVGAFGGVLVNLAFRQSFLTYHNGNAAYLGFVGWYALCFVLTWLVYLRPSRGRLADG